MPAQITVSDPSNSIRIESPTLPTHPYHPPDLQLPLYAANEWDLVRILGCFTIVLGALLAFTMVVVRAANPGLKRRERATVWWFILSGSLHLFFEGYFVLNHKTMVGKQDLFAQLWKEYALSDSRYLSGDTLILCMEALTTMIWGPLCFLVAYLITTSSPLRHPMQIIICVAHLYGVAIYYSTSLYELLVQGVEFSRPEPLYLWGYFAGFNIPWVIVPAILLMSSVTSISRAFRTLERMNENFKKMDETLKKGSLRGRSRGISNPKWKQTI